MGELQRLYGRLTPTATASNMNAVTTVAVGASALTATQAPLAFIAIPIFWSAWLLHALMLDLETLKDGERARWLEKEARKYLAINIFVSESRLVRRSQRRRPLVFYASFTYTALLNLGSWVSAIVILIYHELEAWPFSPRELLSQSLLLPPGLRYDVRTLRRTLRNAFRLRVGNEEWTAFARVATRVIVIAVLIALRRPSRKDD